MLCQGPALRMVGRVEAQNLEVSTLEGMAEEINVLKAITGRVAIHAPLCGS